MALSRWLFGPKVHPTGILLGSDTAGKTTLLYQLKMGETITTIPTIGFNVETIERGKRGDFTLWDIGGCDQMRPLIRHYFRPERFILFLHDCSDTERLDESISQLHSAIQMMIDFGTKHIWIFLTKQDLVPPSKRQAVVTELRARFESEVARYNGTPYVSIIDKLGMSALDSSKLHEALDDIKATLDSAEQPQTETRGRANAAETSYQPPTRDELLQRAEAASITAADTNSFWQAFMDGSLNSWDHYSHLRSGYFVMLEALASGTGIIGCADMFLEHLTRLRAGNPQRFRNTAHRTMTVFWFAQIQIAALNFEDSGAIPNGLGRDDFQSIVLNSPSLMDSALWKAYYSKDLMFSPAAREGWHVPDLLPLPAFVANSLQQQTETLVLEANSDRLVRFALIVVQASLSSAVKRGALVKRALQALEISTIRMRSQNQQVAPYSETQGYFWIQIVHACLLSFTSGLVSPDDSHSSEDPLTLARRLSLPAFKSLFKITGEEWKEYYTEKTWSSIAARREFTLPDLKPLPNVINVPLEYKQKMARDEKLKEGSKLGVAVEELSKNEVIATMVAMAMSEEAELET